jgi:hypothetical protein
VFQPRNASFASSSPSTSTPEWTAALAGNPTGRPVSGFGNGHAPDSHGGDGPNVVQGEESAVGGDNARHAAKDALVVLDRGHEKRRIVSTHDPDVGDNTAFGLLHLDHLAEFGGLVRLASAQNLRVGLEYADDFSGRICDALEDAKLRLRDHESPELDHSLHGLNPPPYTSR